ncbi:MarR family winged helix-turn-helix transcriptional regulator [Undibacterium sp. TJN25]|uniref:MarR family winged helix-turn-helix transcriptional regulator n=1 Tax=Undibacterium sp. TJN25 TaxID=3413056 RepID=UPI003BF323A2
MKQKSVNCKLSGMHQNDWNSFFLVEKATMRKNQLTEHHMPEQKKQTSSGNKKIPAGSATPASMSFNARIEGIHYDVLDQLIGYAVRRAQLSIYEDFAASLAAEDITPQRFSSLVIIENNPGISQTKLSEVMGIARSGVVSIIDGFEKNGFVERQAAGDRRSYNLLLTKAGIRELKKYKKLVETHDERISGNLTVAEKQQLRALLRKLGTESAD